MSVTQAHEALRAVLLAEADVAAITTTIKPWQLWRTDELPAITYQNISRTGFYSYDGAFDWRQRRIQLTCWSNDYDEAQSLARAVRAVDGRANFQQGEIAVHRMRVDDSFDGEMNIPDGREQPPYGVNVDVIMAYEHIAQGV
jgi:hypothetical protein